MSFGFVKSFDADRLVGVIETAADGDVVFILKPGESVPALDSVVRFSVAPRAVNIVTEPNRHASRG